MREGFELSKNSIKFDGALVVCNTKFSEHAIRYAKCKGIGCIGWRFPEERGLERLIEDRKLYPVTFLKGLDEKSKEKFGDAGIVMLKQLVSLDLEEIYERSRIPRKKLRSLVRKAKEILSSG